MLSNVIDSAPNVSRIRSNYGIGDIFGIVINVAMGIGVSIAVIYIVLAGVRFITSQGDPKAMGQAKHALTYAIVALALSIGALAFKMIIFNIVGVTDSNLTNSTPGF